VGGRNREGRRRKCKKVEGMLLNFAAGPHVVRSALHIAMKNCYLTIFCDTHSLESKEKGISNAVY